MLFYSQKIFSLCLNVWVLTADCWQIYFNYHERVEILLLLDARKVRLMQWRSGEGGIVVQNWREGVCKREYSVFEGGKGTKVQKRECIGRWVLLLQVLSAEPAIWFYTAFIIWVKFFSYKVIFNICFIFKKYAILVPTANSLGTVCMILYVDMLSLCDHYWLLIPCEKEKC